MTDFLPSDIQDLLPYLLLPLAGFAAGIVNTIAGGGSFLTLPCLMLVGLSEQVANGTNRVAILLQSLYAVRVYHQARPIDTEALPRLVLPSLPGLALGAYLATALSPGAFREAMGALFLGFVVFMLLKPKLLLAEKRHNALSSPWLVSLVFFLVGAYAGFLQAGVGLLLLVSMAALQGRELLDANGLKLGIVAVWIVPTVAWFAWNDQIEWLPGLTLGAGNFFGARVGAKLAIAKGNKLIFSLVVIVMVATGLSLLFR